MSDEWEEKFRNFLREDDRGGFEDRPPHTEEEYIQMIDTGFLLFGIETRGSNVNHDIIIVSNSVLRFPMEQTL